MAQRLPLDPGAVISRALEIYRDNAAILIQSALAIFAIQAILSIVLGGALGVFVSLLSVVLGTFYQGMVVELVRDVQDGRLDSSVGQLFSAVGPVLITLLAVSILLGIGVAIGFVLIIIPGLFLLTIWSVTAPVVVLERAGVIRAFTRSRELVRGNGWSVFAVILVVFVGLAVVSTLAAIISSGLGDVGSAIVSWLVTSATAPVSALTAAVLYLTLRERAGEPPVSSGPATPGADAGTTAPNPFGA
jgi:ABC-type multidrug transport system fused ATPase/permease subunit